MTSESGSRGPLSVASTIVSILCWIVIIWTAYFLFVNPGRLRTILFPQKPCAQPIHYSFGSIDPRFNVSTSTLGADIEKATSLWGNAVQKPLFVYDPNGPLKINLVYDNRQEATDKLKKLGYTISNDKSSFDSVKAKYDSMKAAYTEKKASFEKSAQNYKTKLDAYNAMIKKLNDQGGVPQDRYADLKVQQATLNAEGTKVRQAQTDLNAFVDQLNALGTVLNRQAKALNLKISQTNNVSQSLGDEFEEGQYVSDDHGIAINIFTFDSPEELVRVLAHEFGHALGLNHVDDPTAVMYYLNQGKPDKLSQTDVNAVSSLCKIQK